MTDLSAEAAANGTKRAARTEQTRAYRSPLWQIAKPYHTCPFPISDNRLPEAGNVCFYGILVAMRRAVRAIIIKENHLLVMRRNKFGTRYDTLPGGNIEVGETPEQALRRELQEETMVVFKDPRLVFIEHSDPMYGDQYIFLCEYVSGEPQLHPDSEEQRINRLGKNTYQPGWLPLDRLAGSPFLSDKLQHKLLEGVSHGWPENVEEFSSTRNV